MYTACVTRTPKQGKTAITRSASIDGRVIATDKSGIRYDVRIVKYRLINR